MRKKLVISLLLVCAATALPFAAVAFGMTSPTARFDTNTEPVVLHLLGALPRLNAAYPGESETSTITVSNSGAEAATLLFTLDTHGSTAALAEYTFGMSTGGRVVYSGPLRARLALPLGLLGAHGARTVHFELRMLRSATLQGAEARFSGRFQASQPARS
jgi:hypothetical protein